MKTRTLLVLFGCTLVACTAWFSLSRAQAPEPPLAADLNTRIAFWKERIDAIGPARAYTEFADDVAPLSANERHENAHTFGAALYESKGVSGLTTCDSRFSYGCFHEFLGRAIAALGLGVVNSLNQDCVDALGPRSLSCQHGIGHGIEAALGYDEAALQHSLDTCHSLPYTDPIGGCYGGVFMEYNMQTMLGDQAVTRPQRPGDPLYPCDILASTYRPACAFWSPQWWIDLQHQSGSDHFDIAAVGALCDSLHELTLVRACYEGLGTIVPGEAAFDAAQTRTLCEASSDDPVRQLYCKSYAANSLAVGGSGQTGDALAVCAGLSESAATFCDAYARNEANIAGELPDFNE
jgi:hypothetical protein